MKRLSAVIGLLIVLAIQAPIAQAGEWQPTNSLPTPGQASVLAIKLTSATSDSSVDENTCLFPVNSSLQGFRNTIIPLSMARMKLSLINISPDSGDKTPSANGYGLPRFQLNTGLQTDRFAMAPPSETLGGSSDWKATAYILFFGVNLNMGSGFIQARGYVSRPMDNPHQAPGLSDADVSMNAKGLTAIAGYKFSNRLTLKAGCGYIDQKDKKAGTSDEAWAVYAQAILDIAPGVQVIPGVGQINFGKDPSSKNTQKNFFAGAKWRINF